jgi:crossover junction endodeoxyribonuclease RusA
MDIMKIELPFVPPSLNSLYPSSRNGIRFKSKRYKEFIEKFAIYVPEKTESLHIGDLHVEINLYFGDRRRHDIDNFNKAILDTLVEYEVIGDDNQITRLVVEKYYDKGKPYTIIEIKQHETS